MAAVAATVHLFLYLVPNAWAARVISTHNATGEDYVVQAHEHEVRENITKEGDVHVWAPAGGFPGFEGQVNSPAYTLRDGSYFWVTYIAKNRFECEQLRFHLPKWRPKISGRVIAAVKGSREEFYLTGNPIYFQCNSNVANITLIVEDNSSNANTDVQAEEHEDGFAWAPVGGFPNAYGDRVKSPAYTLSDGSYFFVTYYPEDRYECVKLRFQYPKWAEPKGRVIVYDKGFPVQVNFTGGSPVSLGCELSVTNVTVMVNMRDRPSPQRLLLCEGLDRYVTKEGQSGFVWEPPRGFPEPHGQEVATGRVVLQDGSYFTARYRPEDRYECGALYFKAPKYRNFTGLGEVVAFGFPHIFRITDSTRISFGCAQGISRITFQVDPSGGSTTWSDGVWESPEYFVWQPRGGFPFTGGSAMLSEPFYPPGSSNGSALRLRYSPDSRYDCNIVALVAEKGGAVSGGLRATLVVVAQGYPKKFDLTGASWNQRLCAEGVSKVAVRLSPP